MIFVAQFVSPYVTPTLYHTLTRTPQKVFMALTLYKDNERIGIRRDLKENAGISSCLCVPPPMAASSVNPVVN